MAKEQQTNSKKKLTDENKKKLVKLLRELLDNDYDKRLNEYAAIKLKERVLKAFDLFDLTSYEIHQPSLRADGTEDEFVNDSANFSLVKQSTITYDIDKLRMKMSKKNFKRVVKSSYRVTDIGKLKELLSEYDVPLKEFKKYIEKQETLDAASLKKYYDIGEIPMEELVGCYAVKPKAPYIKMTISKNDSAQNRS